jgi:hypothetical protein
LKTVRATLALNLTRKAFKGTEMMEGSELEAKIALAKAQMTRPGSGKSFEWLCSQKDDREPEDYREAAIVLVYAQFEQLVELSEQMGPMAHTWHDFLQDALAECISKQVEKTLDAEEDQ